MTEKLTYAAMVTLVLIVKNQNAIHTLNVTTGYVKMSENVALMVVKSK